MNVVVMINRTRLFQKKPTSFNYGRNTKGASPCALCVSAVCSKEVTITRKEKKRREEGV
ncbi:MAG: hypothetical protein HKK67_01255 [Chlorobiaceae bacterium]|nr:hypothetical protein [Chlorobiaceae bacterium]